MFDLSMNYNISRKIASEGMVLLKNESNVLPLKEQKVGIIGKDSINLISGGGGSAAVKCEYIKTLLDGLREKQLQNKIIFDEESVKIAEQTNNYTLEQINMLSKNIDTAIVVFKRYSSEGADRLVSNSATKHETKDYAGENETTSEDSYDVGYFCPSQHEIDLLKKIEASDIQNVILILNISSLVDISYINRFPKIKSVLLTYLPGMEAGSSIADILCGDINPCGKLVDTIAYKYEDYPSAESFNSRPEISEYKEDIFVGYRYFETFAPEKVMYPFGFGLSYTKFEFSNYKYKENNGTIEVCVDVKNIGSIPGREVVQLYSTSPKGAIEKPAIELRAYAKTKVLSPGETEKIILSFKAKDMASFDTIGITGFKAAWVLEKGNYEIRIGNSIRNTYLCGSYTVNENTVTEQLTLRFDGSEYTQSTDFNFTGETINNENSSLYDVYEEKISIYDFIKQLNAKELISLAQGQPPAFPLGTAGIGNLKNHKIPNPQTNDGPAGLRRSVNTTCFPCGTLVACTWDKDIQFLMGEALGKEGIATDVDILLAPSMNIHRNPLCGRNFEYLSEDPLITGKTASAIVKGVQSTGLCATIKHFAANNCEYNRRTNNSIVSERALREIYLKGFEIAVKESSPDFIMTSYNKLNGKYTSETAQLLKGVLRDEWEYDGAIMTDWRNHADLTTEIKAGNNIKMPFGYPDHAEKTYQEYVNGEISIEELRENAYYVLKAVMKTNSFLNKNFGTKHKIDKNKTEIPVVSVAGISSTRVLQGKRDDGCDYLYHLNIDQRSQRTFIYYTLDVVEDGFYTISAEISTDCNQSQIWYYNENNERIGTAVCNIKAAPQEWQTIDTVIHLSKGENILKLIFATEPDAEYEYMFIDFYDIPSGDIKLSRLTLSKNN